MHIAVKLLATEEEARKHTIAEAVWREILWVMQRDREVSITVSGGRVSVKSDPNARTLLERRHDAINHAIGLPRRLRGHSVQVSNIQPRLDRARIPQS